MAKDKFERYKELFQANNGILRVSGAIKLGIPEYVIYGMLHAGELIRESRGLYRLVQTEPLGNPDFVQVSLLIPKGVLFLISALFFHGLTTQIPHQVYLALPQSIKKAKLITLRSSIFTCLRNNIWQGLKNTLSMALLYISMGKKKRSQIVSSFANRLAAM